MERRTPRAVVFGLTLAFALAACSSTSRRSGPGNDVISTVSGADTVALRAAFRAALARVGQANAMPADPPALRAYAIYPYLIAARLEAASSGAPVAARPVELDAQVAAFLQVHKGESVTRGLAHDWLVNLAMRQQWPTFLAHVADFAAAADDPVLVCSTLSARLATRAMGDASTAGVGGQGSAVAGGNDALSSAALAVWSQPIDQPAACDGVFDWLLRQGLLTPERVEARARAALAGDHVGLGLKLAAALPVAQAAPLLAWARLLQRPGVVLEALAQRPEMTVEPDALAAGLERLALSDSATAEMLLPALLMRPDTTPQLAGHLQRSVALGPRLRPRARCGRSAPGSASGGTR